MGIDAGNEEIKERQLPLPRRERLEALLRETIWPKLPAGVQEPLLKKEEKEKILGYGNDGY